MQKTTYIQTEKGFLVGAREKVTKTRTSNTMIKNNVKSNEKKGFSSVHEEKILKPEEVTR